MPFIVFNRGEINKNPATSFVNEPLILPYLRIERNIGFPGNGADEVENLKTNEDVTLLRKCRKNGVMQNETGHLQFYDIF